MKKTKNIVHTVELTGTKAFLLQCTEGLVLVDTGRTEDDAQKILEYSESRLGVSLKANGKLCIITHSHVDHLGGLRSLRKACSFKVAVHSKDAERTESASGVKVDIKLEDGTILPYCGGIQVVHIPGHTKGNSCLYLPKKKMLIAGDTVNTDEGGELNPPPEMYCEDVIMSRQKLTKLLNLDIEAILVSHGADITSGGMEKLKNVCKKYANSP